MCDDLDTFENLQFRVILSTAQVSYQQLVVTISSKVLKCWEGGVVCVRVCVWPAFGEQ